MGLLGLLWSSNLASADCPDRLVGEHHAVPILFTESGCQWLQLLVQDVEGSACLPRLKLLANACDGLETFLDCKLGLVCDHLVGLTAILTTLAVSKDDPIDANVVEHGSRDLSSPSTLWLVPHVLSSDAIVLAEGLLDIRKEEEWWGANHLNIGGCNLARIELTDQLFHTGGSAICLPIAAHNELAAAHGNAWQSLALRAAGANKRVT
mmetsp:Transcript_44849/g.103748  ORF Transcript_44849/g.103748 Transcript_44849/m.103748 type:complete len:208 (-) Transcript_44849:159-782(-)